MRSIGKGTNQAVKKIMNSLTGAMDKLNILQAFLNDKIWKIPELNQTRKYQKEKNILLGKLTL